MVSRMVGMGRCSMAMVRSSKAEKAEVVVSFAVSRGLVTFLVGRVMKGG